MVNMDTTRTAKTPVQAASRLAYSMTKTITLQKK